MALQSAKGRVNKKRNKILEDGGTERSKKKRLCAQRKEVKEERNFGERTEMGKRFSSSFSR